MNLPSPSKLETRPRIPPFKKKKNKDKINKNQKPNLGYLLKNAIRTLAYNTHPQKIKNK